jgi:hypothetical protein
VLFLDSWYIFYWQKEGESGPPVYKHWRGDQGCIGPFLDFLFTVQSTITDIFQATILVVLAPRRFYYNDYRNSEVIVRFLESDPNLNKCAPSQIQYASEHRRFSSI